MRRFLLAAAAFLVLMSCSTAPAGLTLPAKIADWQMEGAANCGHPIPAGVKIWRGTEHARQVCTAQYTGHPNATFTLYALPDSTSTFAALQYWEQPRQGRLAFAHDNLFGVVESANADLPTLAKFVSGFKAGITASR